MQRCDLTLAFGFHLTNIYGTSNISNVHVNTEHPGLDNLDEI